MNEIEKLKEIIKACGEYCVELDGYVINPATVACRIINAGYLPVEEVQLEGLTDEEICKDCGASVWRETTWRAKCINGDCEERDDKRKATQATIDKIKQGGKVFRVKE